MWTARRGNPILVTGAILVDVLGEIAENHASGTTLGWITTAGALITSETSGRKVLCAKTAFQ